MTPYQNIINIVAAREPSMRWDGKEELPVWQTRAREKLAELLGLQNMIPCEANLIIEWERDDYDHREIRFHYETEPGYFVPCHLWIPKGVKAPMPAVICLQGHSTGMHISMRRFKYPTDEQNFTSGDEDFALQIIKEGYAALVLEQRSFGERACDPALFKSPFTCVHDANVANLLGRTIIGERAWDVSRAVDLLETIPEIDSEHIALMGLSGGGTATYYAGAMEPRIKVVMPAGAVCSFDESIGVIRHCVCNYIPRMAKYFDMGEIACMIAPRPLIVVTGDKDPIFRVEGVRKVYSVIEEIYQKEGAPNNCKLIVGDGEHRFFKHLAWEPFREYFIG